MKQTYTILYFITVFAHLLALNKKLNCQGDVKFFKGGPAKRLLFLVLKRLLGQKLKELEIYGAIDRNRCRLSLHNKFKTQCSK
jgi:hypothetical protein